jgi:eukaryotic-like serine/threonine-protein kinase
MLSDSTLRHLWDVADLPDLSGTRYEMIAPLGRGGMGRVYRVRDRELDREVALKVLSGFGASAERLRTEARVLARLEHPGIVPVHDAGVLADGRAFYVMTLVRGSRLDDLAATLSSLPERLRLIVRVADAVAFAHAHGIVHRDLTPSNIMIGAFGQVLVMDWGTAKVAPSNPGNPGNDERAGAVTRVPQVAGVTRVGEGARVDGAETGAGVVVGTPGFMAPEQERGDAARADARADVYALGALLGWLLDPTNGGPREAPRPVAAIRDRAMRHEPDLRYPSAEAFGAELSRYLDGLPVEAHQETAFDRLARFGRTYRVAILLVAAYLFMRILLLLIGRI